MKVYRSEMVQALESVQVQSTERRTDVLVSYHVKPSTAAGLRKRARAYAFTAVS